MDFVATSAVITPTGPVDWSTAKAAILAELDIESEYTSLGIRFTGPQGGNAKFARECHAIDREDEIASAFVNVKNGVYHDSGGGGQTLSFWDFALKHGQHGQWIDMMRFYAARAGVDIGRPSVGKGGKIREATYIYRDADNVIRYAVFRYRMPSGKKSFSQHPPDGKGGWRYGPGVMDHVEPLPYRLPDLIAAPLDETIFVFEGEKDVDRAISLDLTATTNHKGANGTDTTWPKFLEYFRGRSCVIVPDNDKSGWGHAKKIAAYLKDVVSSVKILELPGLGPRTVTHGLDLSDWLDLGNSVQDLIQLADAAPEWESGSENREEPKPAAGNGKAEGPPPGDATGEAPESVGEADDDPHRLARLFLGFHITTEGISTLRYWLEEWHRWDGTHFQIVPDSEIRAELNGCIKMEFDRIARETRKVAHKVTTGITANTMAAIQNLCLLSSRKFPSQPAWIDLKNKALPNPREILPAKNGLIHLPAMMEGRNPIVPLTPLFFSPNTLGYDFKLDAPAPLEWLRFLESLWGDDFESIEALQEWFGYLLTADTSQQKILMVVGPKRSGKGTIARILSAMVGRENVSSPTLSGLATNFGLAPLIGKTVAIFADARLSGRADSQVIVERLLSISGEDSQTIDRKHLTSWTGNLLTRFVLISNELPRLGDSSGAMASRMVVLSLTRSFFGAEDTELTQRLLDELPSILIWAIAGWVRLRERGKFTQPVSSQGLLEDLEELSSPISGFIEECCDLGPGCRDEIPRLFKAWKDYCAEKGRDHPGDEQGFGRSLRAAIPSLKTRRKGPDGKRVREYEGIRLKVSVGAPY